MKINYKQIIEDIALDNIKVLPYKDKFNEDKFMPIHDALQSAYIGYYELDITNKVMYITDTVYEFCNKSVDFSGSYYELIDSISNVDEVMNKIREFIVDMILGYSKKSTIELSVDGADGNLLRYLVMHGETTVDKNGHKLIVGMINDVTKYTLVKREQEESQHVLINILDSIPLPIVFMDKEDVIIDMNKAAVEMDDVPKENLIGEKISRYYELCSKRYTLVDREDVNSDEKSSNYNLHLNKDGTPFDLNVEKLKIFNKEGETLGQLIIYTDITKSVQNINKVTKLLKANELSIEIKELIEKVDDVDEIYDFILNRLQKVIPHADSCCFLKLDDTGNLIIASSFGYEKEYADTFKVPFDKSFANRDLKGDYTRSIIVESIQKRFSEVFPEINANDRGFVLNSNITAPISVDGKLYGILSLDSEKADAFDEVDLNLVDYLRIQVERAIIRHGRMKKVVENSITDELTGVYNRRYLVNELEKYINRAVMNNEHFSFVVFDIDYLKRTNDIYGHLAGDIILKEFSNFANGDMREDDMLARCGGDEFVGLFRNSSIDDTKQKIEGWRTEIADNEYAFEGEKLSIEFSYGIAMYPEDGHNFEDLMEVADKLMYKQKNERR